MARPDDIVGYTYAADTYCPNCIIDALPTGKGEKFDGWGLAKGVTMSAEQNLSEMAPPFCIDRMDEFSFDSNDFPKVIFRDAVVSGEECANCAWPLDEAYQDQ